MLMKLTAAANFINILWAHFLYEILTPDITKLNVIREKLKNLLLYKKCARKMLMKFTPGCAFAWNRGIVRCGHLKIPASSMIGRSPEMIEHREVEILR